MKRVLLAAALAAVALAVPPSSAGAVEIRAQVNLAPMGRSYSPPPLGRKQGWLTISNRDWDSYSLVVMDKDKLALYRAGSGYGGVVIPSGATITIALNKDTYDLYGNNPDRLKVRVREGRTTTLSLEPFGYVGNTGLVGVVNDGDRVRNGTLFDTYTAPVVVQRPPTVIVNRPPPPPPVIISRPPAYRPPVIVGPGPGRRPPYGGHRPPPPPPPRRGHKDGWGFVFGMSSGR